MNTKKNENGNPQERQGGSERPDPSQLNAVENFYERFRGVDLKHLDMFIGGCAAAFVLVVILGMLKGWGIL